MISDQALTVIFWLLAAVVFLYQPISLFLYWHIKIRNGRAQQFNLIREREISGFFGRRPNLRWSGWSYVWPMIFSTLVTIIGFSLAFPALSILAAGTAEGGSAAPIPDALRSVSRPLFFSVLGAFLFALYKITRRFNANDLNPAAYFQIATRMIVAVIVAAIFSLAFTLRPAGEVAADTLTRLIYVLAFVVGIFPENGLNWILSFARQYAPSWISTLDPKNKLQHLEGMNYWHAMRLGVEGIDNVYNLANADVYDLVQRTTFPVQQIFDWVDQAVLFIHLQDDREFKLVQSLGIRGFNDFQTVYRNDKIRQPLVSKIKDGDARLDVLYMAMQQAPSSDPIRLFWQYKSSYLTGAFDHFNRGRVFAELDNHDRAIEQFNLALTRNPLDPLLLINKARSERAIGATLRQTGQQKEALDRFQQAINDFSRAINLEPFSTEALLGRATTYREMRKFNLSIEDLNRLLEYENNNVAALNEMAMAYVAQDDVEKAIETLQKVKSKDAQTMTNLASIYRRKKGFDEAELWLNRAIEVDSSRPEIYHGRALLYVEMGRYSSAYQDFDRAIDLGATNKAEIYTDKGRALFQEAQLAPRSLRKDFFINARANLTLAINSDQSYAEAYTLRGATYVETDQLNRALDDYTHVIEKINPNHATALINRGIIYSRLEQHNAALFDLNKGLNINPDLIIGYINRGQVHEQLGRPEEAKIDYRTAIDVQERQVGEGTLPEPLSTPYLNLGSLLLREQEQLDQAETYLTRAIEINPNAPEAFSNRGLVRSANGRLSSALEDFRRAVRLAPQNPLFHYHLGLANFEAGFYEEAVNAFDDALALDPNLVEARLFRARTQKALGNFEQAEVDVDAILEDDPFNMEAEALKGELTQ